MIPLLVKDIRIQKRFIVIGVLFIAVFFFALGAFEGIPLAMPAAIFSHFLIVVASKSDEKNNNGRMLASLPVTRRDIVTAKYAGVLMFTAIAFGLTAGVRLLAAAAFPSEPLPMFSLHSIVVTVLILLGFYSLYFPLFFAFGYRISQVIDLIVMFIIGSLGLLTLRLLELAQIRLDRSALLPIAESPWLAAGCGLLLFVISWLVSLNLYERKNI